MPDIGLLQGQPRPRPSIVPMTLKPEPPAEPVEVSCASGSPAGEIAAKFSAPTPVPAVDPPRIPAFQPTAPSSISARDLLWLALALLVIFGTGLGMRDPWPADEPRFAVIARDMVATGEWLFPRVGADLYADKPPLFFWMLATCYALFGSIKWAFLVPSLLAAASTIFLIYDFGRRLVSREAGLGAALITVSTLHFVMTLRGAQIDPMLCGLTTLSLYALLRHLLLGPSWGWYMIGGAVAGLGVITKGVGFLPLLVLLPFFALRGFGWRGLAVIDGGALGWRWWLAPIALLLAIALWFVPMLLAVKMSGSADYAAYRDEILFHQTVGRYAASWHHVKGWWYFLVEVVPPLWIPWSLLLFWLVPRYRAAWQARDARVWLPLLWVLLVLVFFSISPGKRGVYIVPALPALALASLPFMSEILARPGVRRLGWALALLLFGFIGALALAHTAGVPAVVKLFVDANLPGAGALYGFLVLCAAGFAIAWRRAPLAAWPVAMGALAVLFSYSIAPAMNAERSGSGFVRSMLSEVKPGEQLALVAYKEQFLLYLDRPTVNFGHRRWMEGLQEAYDASAWLNATSHRVLLVPDDDLGTLKCFPQNATKVGHSSDTDWYLVRGPASAECAAKGDARKAIHYAAQAR